MRTYVRMVFHSEGASPVEVRKAMREIGFEESMGMHDFSYRWTERAGLDEVMQLIGKLHAQLKGLDVHYEITTIS
jgi:hypothetical protein